ncbi:HpcH/HpaI aldolase family protein [Limimaricola sp.]|uniref:HpcH/HpaI aldolase family protein n=1 Tax=Limimaricola sp. TaxID=2211665 RepID=UPI0040580601
METPKNRFKTALREGRQQIGLWNMISGPLVPEALSGLGYDWVVIDTEHSPTDVSDVLPALQAMAAEPMTSAVVRPAWNDPVIIKRLLDFGAQTLLIPYVQSAEEARAAVAATRYPPVGMRGVAGLHRATRYGRIGDYTARAHEETCVLVQVETKSALDRLEEIAGVEGVDGVFFGPADLSASLGHPGQLDHPEVVAALMDGIDRLKAMGVPSGILSLDPDFARACIARGTGFTAVGIDASLMLGAARDLLERFR